MTSEIENKVERFALDLRNVFFVRHVFNTEQLEEYNPNYIGGDISGRGNRHYTTFYAPGITVFTLPHFDKRPVYLFFFNSSRGWCSRIVRISCRQTCAQRYRPLNSC